MACSTPIASAILTMLKMIKFQSMLDLHRHSGFAERRPRQTIERGNVPRHFVEQTFNRQKTVLSRDVVNEVMQKFPFGASVAGSFDRFHKFLDATFDVRKRAAFFGMS